MAKNRTNQTKAQRDYVRDLRIQNSILYQAKATKPRCFQNIDIILKTMKYNELDATPNSAEATKAKAINTGLLIFTILFEVTVIMFRIVGFFLTIGQKRRRRRAW
jgi:hypothetical protein